MFWNILRATLTSLTVYPALLVCSPVSCLGGWTTWWTSGHRVGVWSQSWGLGWSWLLGGVGVWVWDGPGCWAGGGYVSQSWGLACCWLLGGSHPGGCGEQLSPVCHILCTRPCSGQGWAWTTKCPPVPRAVPGWCVSGWELWAFLQPSRGSALILPAAPCLHEAPQCLVPKPSLASQQPRGVHCSSVGCSCPNGMLGIVLSLGSPSWASFPPWAHCPHAVPIFLALGAVLLCVVHLVPRAFLTRVCS